MNTTAIQNNSIPAIHKTPGFIAPVFHDVAESVDLLRLDVSRQLEQGKRSAMGQYMTPHPVARLMASMLRCVTPHVSILDAGAGIGSLFAACVADFCKRTDRPISIHVTAYEIDPVMLSYLGETVAICRSACDNAGISFTADVRSVDFIEEVSGLLTGDLFAEPLPNFTAAILNPPYKKINATSDTRKQLRAIGIETSNLYTAFLSIAMQLLAPSGELVAITPRSFCNGTYFRSFREAFLRDMALQNIHLFDTRDDAFRDDSVLQETIIVHAIKTHDNPERVTVTTSANADDEFVLSRDLFYKEVVHPDDPERFIRVVSDGTGQQIVNRMSHFKATLTDLGLTVSTGRAVDFRATEYLRGCPAPGDIPLIYPVNLEQGVVVWPRPGRKPQALTSCKETESLLVPNENYTLVKRFTSKEQTRRVISAVFEGKALPGSTVAFENHLNYFHKAGRGLDLALARGLSVYLNSSIVDAFFRQFNGHTQVNATDLRSLKYPSLSILYTLGGKVGDHYPTQTEIDNLIELEFFSMADPNGTDPLATTNRITEASSVLGQLGFPKPQANERSALTLLALLNLLPGESWQDATNPLCGITPMMLFMEQKYGKKYAANTRESIRRQTIHQFLDAGLIVANPDDPKRPVNSGNNVYQIETSALLLLRTWGTPEWDANLTTYLASVPTLKHRYAQERDMQRIPLIVAPGKEITLSPGGQNVLVEQIIKEFAPRFTPGANIIYVGDADEKYAYFDTGALAALGVEMDSHGKMPDVIIHHVQRNWLVLIEAVTSHGPINPKRKLELETLFAASTAGLVLITTFMTRSVMLQYISEISWETEVWVADSPSHMIHFNGERFLGPY